MPPSDEEREFVPSIYSWWDVHVRHQYMHEYADVAKHDLRSKWRRKLTPQAELIVSPELYKLMKDMDDG